MLDFLGIKLKNYNLTKLIIYYNYILSIEKEIKESLLLFRQYNRWNKWRCCCGSIPSFSGQNLLNHSFYLCKKLDECGTQNTYLNLGSCGIDSLIFKSW